MYTSWPGSRLALSAFGVAMIIVAACTSAAASPSPVATGTPIVTPAPTEAPTDVPTAVPSPTPACTVTTDRPPTLGETFYISGAGYDGGINIKLTMTSPLGTTEWGGPDGEVQPAGLHTTAEGAFGPYDIAYVDPSEAGDNSITASDGSCEATVTFTVVVP